MTTYTFKRNSLPALDPSQRLPEDYECTIDHQGHKLSGMVGAVVDELSTDDILLRAVVFVEGQKTHNITIRSLVNELITRKAATVADLHALMRTVAIYTCSHCGHAYPYAPLPASHTDRPCNHCIDTSNVEWLAPQLATELAWLKKMELAASQALETGNTETMLARQDPRSEGTFLERLYGHQKYPELAVLACAEQVAFCTPELLQGEGELAMREYLEPQGQHKSLRISTQAYLEITRDRLQRLESRVQASDGSVPEAALRFCESIYKGAWTFKASLQAQAVDKYKEAATN